MEKEAPLSDRGTSRDDYHLWHALSLLGDWFACFGGSRCFAGYDDTTIPIFVTICLVTKRDQPEVWSQILQTEGTFLCAPGRSFWGRDHLSVWFVESTKEILGTVLRHLDEIEFRKDGKYHDIVSDFTDWIDSQFEKARERKNHNVMQYQGSWDRFKSALPA